MSSCLRGLHIPLWLGDVLDGTSAGTGTRGRENRHTQDTNNISITDWILVQANLSIWRIEPLGTVIYKVWLGRLMRVAVLCWSYVRVAVHAGVLTSHRFPMISACVASTWECGVALVGQLVSGLMDSRPQMPSVLSRTKGLLGQRKLMSLVSIHIFWFGARYNCSLLSWYATTSGVWILT